jgi:hypothetical protein
MIVRVTADATTLELAGEFTEFKVVVDSDCADLAETLAAHGAGLLDGDSAIIHSRWVEANAADSASAAWQSGFSGMLAYAGTKGWLTEDGTGITAHIEQHS